MGPEIASGAADGGPNEVRVWGPPGCGKTTYLAKQVKNAAAKFGRDNVLVTSFTKAAATELAGRDLQLTKGLVGTLHSHCYRALNNPVIAETKVAEWNKDFPRFRLTATVGDVDEPEPEYSVQTYGDELYAKYQVVRAKMIATAEWPLPIRQFEAAWSQWKDGNGLTDFTDLIEIGLRDFPIAPSNPNVIFVDEAQDLSRLQLAVVRRWGRHADYMVLAADDDQTIFSHVGAAPDVLLQKDGPEHFRHVLSQSYRVPRTVHALSRVWIEQVHLRENKVYKARDGEGEVRLLHKGDYRTPEPIVEDAHEYLAAGKTVMFLATCSYMVEPLKRVLRDRGLPFHNPYRRKRIDWNPLEPAKRGVAPVDRVLAYLRAHDEAGGDHWAGQDLQRWSAWLRPGVGLVDGAPEVIERMVPTFDITIDVLKELFDEATIEELVAAVSEQPLSTYLDWWLTRLVAKKRKVAEYPAKVAIRHGVPALLNQPRIIIGTGHSVKGGEADVVYILPDLSRSGIREWEGPREQRDAIIRLAYVMMTRARETLVICDSAGPRYIPIAEPAARLARDRRAS